MKKPVVAKVFYDFAILTWTATPPLSRTREHTKPRGPPTSSLDQRENLTREPLFPDFHIHRRWSRPPKTPPRQGLPAQKSTKNQVRPPTPDWTSIVKKSAAKSVVAKVFYDSAIVTWEGVGRTEPDRVSHLKRRPPANRSRTTRISPENSYFLTFRCIWRDKLRAHQPPASTPPTPLNLPPRPPRLDKPPPTRPRAFRKHTCRGTGWPPWHRTRWYPEKPTQQPTHREKYVHHTQHTSTKYIAHGKKNFRANLKISKIPNLINRELTIKWNLLKLILLFFSATKRALISRD